VGGSDSCAGAGVQADLRVFASLGVVGCSAITALTAQNPARVLRVEPVPLAQFDAELHAVSDYYDIAAVKTGMLTSAGHIAVLLAWLDLHAPDAALVVDPVMRASSGKALLDEAGAAALRQALAPRAMLLTPNLDEAAALLERPVTNQESDAAALAGMLNCHVLLKGGHGEGEILIDVLADPEGATQRFEHPRKQANEARLHGTGCRLAAGIAAFLAQGETLEAAISGAIKHLRKDQYSMPCHANKCDRE